MSDFASRVLLMLVLIVIYTVCRYAIGFEATVIGFLALIASWVRR